MRNGADGRDIVCVIFVVGFYDFIVLNIILIRKNTLTHVFLRSNI